MAVRKYGDGLRCANAGNDAKDPVKTRANGKRSHVCTAAFDFTRKSQEQRPKALKTEVEGDGRTRSSAYLYDA